MLHIAVIDDKPQDKCNWNLFSGLPDKKNRQVYTRLIWRKHFSYRAFSNCMLCTLTAQHTQLNVHLPALRAGLSNSKSGSLYKTFSVPTNKTNLPTMVVRCRMLYYISNTMDLNQRTRQTRLRYSSGSPFRFNKLQHRFWCSPVLHSRIHRRNADATADKASICNSSLQPT